MPGHGLRRARRFNASGTTALEFAILAVPFTAFVLFIFEVGFDYYLQSALDYAVLSGARSVQVGHQTAVNAVDFKNKFVCPPVAGLLTCGAISVNVLPVSPDYYTQAITQIPITGGVLNTASYTFNPGNPDQLMLVQAIYTSPSFVGLLAPSWNVALSTGGYTHVTFSSVGFVNERRS